MLLASALVMAAAGVARAQTSLAVIAQNSVPYYASIQDVGIAPPVGQFAANAHLCMKNAVVNWNGRKFLQFFIQSRGAVYAAFNLEAITRDPASDKKCESIAAQVVTQSKGMDQRTGDAMAASSEASAQAPLAVITQTGLPYFPSPQAANSKPLGQFAFNTHVCVTGKTYTWNGLQFFQYVLPSGELVYTLAGKRIFARDPAGDKSCMSQVASTALPASIPPPVQRAPQPAPQTPTATASPDIAGTITSANDPSMRADIETDGRVMQEAVRAQVDSLYDAAIASANKNNCDSARKDVAKIPDILKKAKIDISLLKDRHTAIETEMQNKMVEILGSIQACDMRASAAERKAPPPSPEPTGSSPQTTAQAPTQAKGMDQRTGDAVAATTTSGTSAQSPEQLPSEAAQAQSNVGSSGTVAGPLEDGYAAERRGDFQAAFLLLEPLAKQGNAKAQFQLGHMYHTGKGGVPQDYTKALEWFRKAADQGNADAQFNLGSMYYVGQVVPQDYAEAMKWYRKAADQGNAGAQKYLARLSEEMAKSTVPDLPDPRLQDPKEAMAALSYLKSQLTISVNFAGDLEPGLASLQSINGGLCHLRCGFHLAAGIGQGGVLDSQVDFALSDININSGGIRYNMDAIGRAFLSFDTSDGTPRFSRRDREMDMNQKVLSPWSEWESVDKGSCRAKGDKDSLERDMKALQFLAQSCGAKESPF
jgi:tetratricopeptide (TPR) repeat protein